MTTALAQRRLLEALASLEHGTAGGLGQLEISLPAAIEFAEANELPALADVWRRLADLVAVVKTDLKGAAHG